uniref:Uncharacterized protein n=1 Tax=Arundo donax TaxID=35708 RepID=A0A0A8ZZB2_ARUDO
MSNSKILLAPRETSVVGIGSSRSSKGTGQRSPK